MKKENFKRYNSGILRKDLFIGFLAGIGGGFTVWYFTLIVPFLLNREYKIFIIGFIFYLIIGMMMYIFSLYVLIKTFGKQKNAKKQSKRKQG